MTIGGVPMAIDFTVSHEEKLVVATIGAGTRRSDYPKFLEGMSEANAHGYRKIVDLSFATLDYFKIADLRAFGQIVAAWGKAGNPGPTALIINSELSQEMADLFREHAKAARPVQVFTDAAAARAWLDEVAPLS
jgi:hypothetical protein